jgi:predicted transcriptional regulator of viral defense system
VQIVYKPGGGWVSKAKAYIDDLTANGCISFTIREFCDVVGVAYKTAKKALAYLKKEREIASPSKGYYLILTPEFRKQGCLPADYFIDDLMRHLNKNYYICLLSAALYYGAAHQQPQKLQVMIDKKIRNIQCGNAHIEFIRNSHCSKVPTQQLNTKTGTIKISTPEATAMDMMKYMKQSGGVGRVATVLDELAESLSAKKLNEFVTQLAEHSSAFRLGFLLDKLGHHELAEKLYETVKTKSVPVIPLVRYTTITGAPRNKKWHIAINANVESDVNDTD